MNELNPNASAVEAATYLSTVQLADGSTGSSLDISSIVNSSDVEDLLRTIDQVDRVQFNGSKGCKLSGLSLDSVILPFIDADRFRSLKELNLSYIRLSDAVLTRLCEQISPFHGKWKLRLLTLTRCQLAMAGTLKLLRALFENVPLEELNITGNMCTDACIPRLVEYISRFKNSLHTISLGSNQLTADGIMPLFNVLSSKDNHIRYMYLGNNPLIGDSLNDTLFRAVHTGGRMHTLDLRNTGLKSCDWSRYLPFLNSLTVLGLAQNLIGDEEFVVLFKNMETCYSLKQLDISFNKCRGTKCNVIQFFLEQNKSLAVLNLSSNRFIPDFWRCVSFGLRENSTLSELHVTGCNINQDGALQLCAAFEKNDTCTIHLDYNPLPVTFISDPRRYCMELQESKNKKFLPLNPKAEVIRLKNSIDWCSERQTQVKDSLDTLEIMENHYQRERQQELEKKQQDIIEKSVSLDQHTKSSLLNSLNKNQSTTTTNEDASKHDKNKENTTLLLEKSEYYLSHKDLKKVVAESDMINNPEWKQIYVSYGRRPLSIGHIRVSNMTTYEEAANLIRPLVKEYVKTTMLYHEEKSDDDDGGEFESTLDQNNLVRNFKLMDPSGATVTSESASQRRVWAELCDKGIDNILVRPANWVTLDASED